MYISCKQHFYFKLETLGVLTLRNILILRKVRLDGNRELEHRKRF